MSQGWAFGLLEVSELAESGRWLERVLGLVPVAEAPLQESGLLACQNQTITASIDDSFLCPRPQADHRPGSTTREAAAWPQV